jgi:hypothetical protein
MTDRYDSPDIGLPIVESVCANGHGFAGELDWTLPMVFPEDIPLRATCPECGAPLIIKAGSYERAAETKIYVRTGPPDPSVVVLIGDPG